MKFINEGKTFKPTDIKHICEQCKDAEFVPSKQFINNRRVHYLNIPISFDIETTSLMKHTLKGNGNIKEKKQAFMYIWMLGICGYVIIGRTWEEFTKTLQYLSDFFMTTFHYRIIIYVHNLSYEFQFIKKRFLWESIFALDKRKPVKALTYDGIEFRCSYMLSGYSLANVGKQLFKYPVQKMEGDLDYSLIRHKSTVLSETELKYCENDVRVVMAYIQERIEVDGDISKIPLTKTGYVRNHVRRNTIYNPDKTKAKKYKDLIKVLTLTKDEYLMARQAFAGGFTHANAIYVDKTLKNVDSIDFTSSYPYVMCSEMFPMTKGKEVKINSQEQFNDYINNYCCLIDITFNNIKPIFEYDNIISLSKCLEYVDEIVNNGRIFSASKIRLIITEQDLLSYSQFYTWESFNVNKMIVYKKFYLPKPYVEAVLDLYENKTKFKNLKGKEIEYMWAKEWVNSLYGMMVTDIARDEITFDTDKDWSSVKPNLDEVIERYNKSKSRFLSYLWGVWVTAYARRNVYTGILEFKKDYVYCDTDSNKVLNIEKHMDYINRYNEMAISKLTKCLETYKIPLEKMRPKDIKGEEHILGIWDWETKNNKYLKFKTLGAKRYLTYQKDGHHMTVAGLPKKAVAHILETYGPKVFDVFKTGLFIPKEDSYKNLVTYLDEEDSGKIKDYMGNSDTWHEYSSVHIMPNEFEFNRSVDFINFLFGLTTENYL